MSKLATALAASTGLGLAGLGLATSSAQGPSYQGENCPAGVTCTHWFPGEPAPPGGQVLSWDWNAPHDWYWNSEGIVDVTTNTMYPWSGSPHPAAPPPAPVGTPPAPLTPPPGMPFCSPRGSLVIIPPICDEIGYDWPPGSLR